MTKVAERQVQAILLLEKVSNLLVELKNQTDIPVHDILLEWEAAMTLEHSFEKEWLYFEGVKDGMRLVYPIYFNLEDSQSKI
ncbi:MAG: hypothetical protein JWM44_4444 [Bacilli bacterium]|nr:hypothetical protein [Bacilli bacterium]